LTAEIINLYHLDAWLIRPATQASLKPFFSSGKQWEKAIDDDKCYEPYIPDRETIDDIDI